MGVQLKGTLFYQAGSSGWTETHWLVATDMPTATLNLKSINNAGMAMRRPDVTLLSARIVDAANPRTSILPDITSWVTVGTYTAPGVVTADVDLSIMWREFSADNLTRSRVFFRGFPTDQFGSSGIDKDGNFNFTVAFAALFTAWQTAIVNNALLVHRTAPHVFTSKAINQVVQSTQAHLRRAGRPFFLRRGRRLIA